MLRDITLGQYYPADSVIHKLDPRVKLAGTMVFIISLFAFHSIEAYIVATLALAAVIRISKVPFRFMVRGPKSIIMLLLITVVFNLFLIPGTPVVHFWKLTVTREGIETAVAMAVRLVYLIVGSSVMTLTTTPNNLTDGLEKAMRPLGRLHVPVHDIAKAQMARGADFESGNLMQKAKNMVPLLVPLFISAFRRANDLAMAMEARGYHGGEGRTKMKPLVYVSRDHMAYLILLLYLIVMFIASRVNVIETLVMSVLHW